VTITIDSEEKLNEINQILHDEILDSDSIIFNEESSSLTIIFYVEDIEKKKLTKKKRAYSTYEVPLNEWSLKINKIVAHEVIDNSRIGANPFDKIIYNKLKGRLELITLTDFFVNVNVSSIDIELINNNKTTDYKSMVKVYKLGFSRTTHNWGDKYK
jgi:hypothetical protein